MSKILHTRIWVIIIILLIAPFTASCGNTDYKMFSLREGIGHFSLEYPSGYVVTRIDIRNEPTTQYSDVGLRYKAANDYDSFKEISVYVWPIESNGAGASDIINDLLTRASTIFTDFEILEQNSIMMGDIEGQVALFSWTASPATYTEESISDTLPAISKIVCIYHGGLAWEIHVASDMAGQEQAEDEFQHILDTFQILN